MEERMGAVRWVFKRNRYLLSNLDLHLHLSDIPSSECSMLRKYAIRVESMPDKLPIMPRQGLIGTRSKTRKFAARRNQRGSK